MDDFQIRRNRHYTQTLPDLLAQLLGAIEGIGDGVDEGTVTAEQAVARIRAAAAKAEAARQASWTELLGSAS